MKPLFPTFVGSRGSQIMMNGEEIEQWPICLAVRTAIALASSSGILQNHFHQIGRVLPKSVWNPFYISQHNSPYYESSPYPERCKRSEKAEEEEGQVAFMKNRNTTATCAKAVGGELRAEIDLCCFPSFYLGFQQVPRDQCAYHQCQWWHSSIHTRLGIYRDNRSQWACAKWETLSLGHWQPEGEQFKDYFIWGCAANSCC